MKAKRLLAMMMTVCMVVGMLSGFTVAYAAEPVTVPSTHHNINQEDGIVLTKTAMPKDDGTVDITISAHTTGEVISHSTVTPTDIVLVLDVSGSMNDPASTIAGYNPVLGGDQSYWFFITFNRYGLDSTEETYYIDKNGAKIPVVHAGEDDNNYDFYTDGTNYYYPMMESGYTNQELSYPIVQFYEATVVATDMSKMEVLKSGAKAFIDTTLSKNEGITDESQMHRISIIKYADNSYYDGTSATDTPSLTVGNNRDSNDYNYTQVVHALAPVTSANATTLKNAIDSLDAGGATAIDYGMNLAKTLLADQVAPLDGTTRAEAIIAFTDGEPNHQSGFDETVANNALAISSALQSTDGVSIYTISMAANADASILGVNQTNQFMHYLSSNYPNATSMSSPGAGDITKGYYMTPDGDHALETIFTGIMQNIGSPHVSMGATAVLTDAISSYFTLADGTNSISLMTAAKTATGWDAPVVDPSLAYTLSTDGKTIKVTGFDYDANYISETPRDSSFYGKALVVQMNVKPVNDIIDAGSSVHNGTLPTNAGNAFLADSENISRAEVATPTLNLPKITYSYTVDGANSVVYATKYRLPDTTETVLEGLEREGYTFEGWNAPAGVTVNAGTYIVPNAHVEFTGNLVPKTYNVTYVYTGTSLTSPPTLPSSHTAKYAQTVTVADPVTPPAGYQFVGWTPLGTDVTIDKDTNQFVMPARDVTLVGHFEPEETTPYTVEHYLQNLDGATYHLHEEEDKVGKTDETAVAIPKNSYTGFTYDAGNANEVLSAKIKGDGSTVLKIYYNRNKYDVTYIIDGANKPVSAPAGQTSVMYGETVNVAENLDVPGYDFSGWENDAPSTDPNYVAITPGGTFTMPAADVVISGSFSKATDLHYTVEHYLQNLDGTYGDGVGGSSPAKTETFQGELDAPISGTPVHFTGFKYDETNQSGLNQPSGVITAGGTTLKLYYLRNKWSVSYEYHGVIPADAPTPPVDNSKYAYGEDVTPLPKVAAPQGYTFHGWRISNQLEEITTFEMPDHDVVLAGHFHPNDNVRYQIEHFYQDENGEYPETPQEHEARAGKTGDSITVYAHKNPGFVLDETETNSNNTNTLVAVPGTNDYTLADTIKGDGSTVLKFYYERQSYKVIYVIEGMAPVNQALYETETTVPYGKEVTLTVIPENEYQGYTFSGWKTEDVEIADGATGFTMPAKDVTLVGSFTADLNKYTVRHLLENLEDDTSGESFGGKYYTEKEKELHEDKRTGALVEAVPKNYPGFHPITTGEDLTGIVKGDGSLVINVYYDRNRYDVSYIYFDDGHHPAGAPAIPSGYQKIDVPYGKTLNVEAKLTMDGYSFDGWYTLTASVDEDGNYTMPDHNVVFYGDFVNLYNVTYDLAGGTPVEGADYSAKQVTPDTDITVAAAPTKSGYNFAGWIAEGTNYTAGQMVRVNHNMHFVAQWTPVSRPGGGGGGGSIKYILTYESNGGTEYDKETHNPGKVVEIDKEPHREGYVFDGWYADKGLTEPIDEVKMTKNHTVYAKWVKDNGTAGNGHETPGALDGEHHFAYVVGYPDGTVRPNDNIDRAEVTAIFFRLLKEEVRNRNLTDVSGFEDVEAEDWFNQAVATMAKLGIIEGRAPGYFEPTDYITRAEFAAICARFDDSEYEIADEFTDVAGHWAENEIHEAAAHGWIKGYEDGTFKPDQFITRAEAMTMINRVLNRIPETKDDLHEDMIVWPDNADAEAWYYLPVQEATNSHEFEMKNHIYEKWTILKDNTDWTIYQ